MDPRKPRPGSPGLITPAILSQTELTSGRTVSHAMLNLACPARTRRQRNLRLRRISCLDFSGTNCKRCDTRARIARKSDPFDVVVWNVVRVNMLLHLRVHPPDRPLF